MGFEKSDNIGTVWRAIPPTGAGAFKGRGGACKADGGGDRLLLCQRQREGTVPYIPCAKRIDRGYGEGGVMPHGTLFVRE
jgi:hypothetical protein